MATAIDITTIGYPKKLNVLFPDAPIATPAKTNKQQFAIILKMFL